ncbi:class I SAM-dependent methyltransferase [Polyangium mundeleinium]|uniref:Class I SAM-dependent methyltransferase n=1 Tax=Polyangium mundeleinium TaxID=2995306 RepID=A0ABT5EQR9_9BACT|nr:class I SAM-dependent methyltransferase [Polyangium mundeleinium]MDC0744184.1 class I SAM-dependent methyltransferase [Polyangium mundeleinium]
MRAVLPHHRPGTLVLSASQWETIEALRAGEPVTDEALDTLYPADIRELSSRFWTPASVAVRAAQLCAPEGRARVLDVGAGVGKFCLVGALVTESIFVGVEHRRALVDVGREVIAAVGARNARLVHGTIEDIDFSYFDALYFYNPFEENLVAPSWQMDGAVPLSLERFQEDVTRIEAALEAAPPGMRVVTYQGFGGKMPPDYEIVEEDPEGAPHLRLWVKQEHGPHRIPQGTRR